MSAGAIAARERNHRKSCVPYLHKAVDRSIDLSLSRDLTRCIAPSNSGAGWHSVRRADSNSNDLNCGSAVGIFSHPEIIVLHSFARLKF